MTRDEQMDAVCADYASGLTIERVAEKHIMSEPTVRKWLILRGVPRRTARPIPAWWARAVALSKIYNATEIARMLGGMVRQRL